MRALVVSLVLIAAVAWLALRGQGERGATAPVAAEEVAAENVAESSAAPATLVAAEAAPEAALAPGAQREAVGSRTLPISGRVVVEGGIPASERALVVARLREEDVPRARWPRVEAPVAPDGSFALEVPAEAGSVQLALRGELLVLREPVVAAPGTEDVELRPRLLALVRGRVHRAGETLGPPADEEPPIQVSGIGHHGCATDAAGEFRLVVEPEKPLVLEARTEGVEGTNGAPPRPRTAASLALDALAPGEVRDVELQLRPFAAQRGLVVDSRGEPVEGATVAARRPEAGAGPESFASTDADGRFELEELAPGDWLVSARARGHFGATELVALPADSERELRLVLVAPAIVRGRVLGPDGLPSYALVLDLHSRPIVGASSAAKPPSSISMGAGPSSLVLALDVSAPDFRPTRADADGRFELEADVPRLRLSAWAPGLAPAAPVELELRPGLVIDDLVLRLRPTCALSGTAVDEDGKPLLSTLEFRSADGLELSLALANGAFDVEQLPPGPATLALRVDPLRGDGAYGSFEVELDPGRETVTELVFRGKRFW